MTIRGLVKNGVVVFQNGTALADGTLVEVRPLRSEVGSPVTVATATEAAPRVSPKDEPVSTERQTALRQLIGIWKTAQPPSDEEVEQLLELERMKKYG